MYICMHACVCVCVCARALCACACVLACMCARARAQGSNIPPPIVVSQIERERVCRQDTLNAPVQRTQLRTFTASLRSSLLSASPFVAPSLVSGCSVPRAHAPGTPARTLAATRPAGDGGGQLPSRARRDTRARAPAGSAQRDTRACARAHTCAPARPQAACSRRYPTGRRRKEKPPRDGLLSRCEQRGPRLTGRARRAQARVGGRCGRRRSKAERACAQQREQQRRKAHRYRVRAGQQSCSLEPEPRGPRARAGDGPGTGTARCGRGGVYMSMRTGTRGY